MGSRRKSCTDPECHCEDRGGMARHLAHDDLETEPPGQAIRDHRKRTGGNDATWRSHTEASVNLQRALRAQRERQQAELAENGVG